MRPVTTSRAAAAALLCLFILLPAASQEPDPVKALAPRSAEAGFADAVLAAAERATTVSETLRILQALAPLASGADKRILHAALAPVLELEERWAEASLAWETAARAVAGPVDAQFIVNAGLCALVSGDAARALSLASAGGARDPRVPFLEAFAYYLSGDRDLALSRALAVVSAGESRLEPAALLLAAELSAGADRETYLARLKTRYPGRPEAAAGGLGARVALLALSVAGGQGWQPAGAAAPAAGTPGSSPAESSPAESAAGWFQVGAFRTQENAQAMVERLAGKGFKGLVARKRSADGVEMIIVYVAAGSDAQATLLGLKDAGFEAWLLPAAP